MKKSKAVAPKKRTASKARCMAPKQGKSRISMREINREIRAYRREREAEKV